jgi:glutaredoxin-related protein
VAAAGEPGQCAIISIVIQLLIELQGQTIYLKDVLEDRKREHDRDYDDWRTEPERLQVPLRQ